MRWKLEMIATDENGKGREMRISYGKIRINGGVRTRRRILQKTDGREGGTNNREGKKKERQR